jgi:uncharacterized protein (TIGR01777 family)
MATVLITGGTGLIGSALTRALLQAGHRIHLLSRSSAPDRDDLRSFRWSPATGEVDPQAWNGVEHVVHLAGAGIADKRWTQARVDELIASRAGTARLLRRSAEQAGARISGLVSAAGINYYGAFTSDHILTEQDPPGTDTIGRISKAWEDAVDEWGAHCRVVKLRTPVVLSRSGGALAKLVAPVRLGLGSPLGSGLQWMPWVHLDDLVAIYVEALFDARFQGAYHVNSGHDVTNAELMRTLSRVLGKPFFAPAVPAFALRLALGELSAILLEGTRATNARLLGTGFRFAHPRLEESLRDLLTSKP